MDRTEDAKYDALYLSPHLDDVALSCGGQVFARARRGERVLVATVFTADPPTPGLTPFIREAHRLWGLADDEVMAVRRREDLASCAVLGPEGNVEARHLGLLDAAYRRAGDEPLYPDWPALRGTPVPADDATLDALVAALGSLPKATRVVAPLGAGGHVDHRLVRRAAERVFGAGLPLYEDLPYAGSVMVLARAIGWRPWRWRREVVPLDDETLDAKCEAVARHASQLAPAFGDRAGMERRLRVLARRRGGERLWSRR